MKFVDDLKEVGVHYYESFIMVLPRMIMALVVFLLMWFIARRTRNALKNRLIKYMDDPLLGDFLSRVIKTLLVVSGLLMALGIVGLGRAASGLLAGAGVSAFIIGFAFKDIGENFLSGIIMAFDRPFKIGHWVSIGGHEGKIAGLSLRDVHLKTFDGRDIYIPNGMIVRNPIINYTIDGYLRQQFNVLFNADSDIDQAIAIIYGVLEDVKGIQRVERQSNIFISDYSPGRVVLTIQYWLDTVNPIAPGTAVKTQVVGRTIKILLEKGYELPAETMEVKMNGRQV